MNYVREERIDVVAVRLRDEVEELFPKGLKRADRLVEVVRNTFEDPAPDFHQAYEVCYALMTEMIQAQRAEATETIPRILGGYKLLCGRLAAAVKDPDERNSVPVFVERYTFGFIAVFEDRTLHLSLTDVD